MREAATFIASQTSSAPAAALTRVLQALRNGFRLWSRRRTLTKVAELDDHLLADIGLKREDVRWALDLPFSHDPMPELLRRTGRGCGWRG